MRRYPTSPPAENQQALRQAEDRKASGGKPEEDGGYAGTPVEPDARGYGHQHSGRRAAGHGGGSLDASEDGADYAVEPDADFSGGGRGHAVQASQQREADEEMEGRTGPYVRSGLAGRDARKEDAAKTRPQTGHDPAPSGGSGSAGGRSRTAGAGGAKAGTENGDPDDPASDDPYPEDPASEDPDSAPPRTGGPGTVNDGPDDTGSADPDSGPPRTGRPAK